MKIFHTLGSNITAMTYNKRTELQVKFKKLDKEIGSVKINSIFAHFFLQLDKLPYVMFAHLQEVNVHPSQNIHRMNILDIHKILI
jgi:hypothetical protein